MPFRAIAKQSADRAKELARKATERGQELLGPGLTRSLELLSPGLARSRELVEKASARSEELLAPVVARSKELVQQAKEPAQKVVASGVILAGVATGLSVPTENLQNLFPATMPAECLVQGMDPASTGAALPGTESVNSVLAGGHDTLSFCQVAASARADGLAQLGWLESPAGREAGFGARQQVKDRVLADQSTEAASRLELDAAAMADPKLSSLTDATAIAQQEATTRADLAKGDTNALSKDYLTLAGQAQASEAFGSALGASSPTIERRLVQTGTLPGAVQQSVLSASKDTDDKSLQATSEKLLKLVVPEKLLAQTVLAALSHAAVPTWSEDHAGKDAPAEVQTAVAQGLAAGKPLAAIGAPFEAAYRQQDGVLAAHAGEISSQGIAPAFAELLPGGSPDAGMVANAQALWKNGGSMADIKAATEAAIRQTPAYRESFVDKNLGVYYPQPDNWSCGPSSGTNVLALEGVLPPSYDTRQQLVDRLGANPDIGTPGGVDYIAGVVKQMAAEHGVQLVGYDGNASDMGAIVHALQQGYVVMVNGDVVGQPSAGHFLVIKKINPDGSLVMADPWTPEFANRTISQAEFIPFTQGDNAPMFYAYARG